MSNSGEVEMDDISAATSEISEIADDLLFERHRPFMRKLDRKLANIYGFGGLLIAVFALLIPALVAWNRHWFDQPILYIAAFFILCLGFAILRSVVKKEKIALRARFENYCKVNEIEPKSLLSEVEGDETYSFVVSLFEPSVAIENQSDQT